MPKEIEIDWKFVLVGSAIVVGTLVVAVIIEEKIATRRFKRLKRKADETVDKSIETFNELKTNKFKDSN